MISRIPPALIFGHPGFLRACHGVQPPGGIFLHVLAFDLARLPDGDWHIVDTRTQAPSGAGYALENRLTVSRLFPDAFRDRVREFRAVDYDDHVGRESDRCVDGLIDAAHDARKPRQD